MKSIKTLKTLLIGLAGFVLGAILFMPWNAVNDYIMAKGLERAAENGIYASVRSCETDGLFDKQFIYRGITADFPVFRFVTSDITVDPYILKTLASSPSSTVEIGRGYILPVTRQKLEWTSGTAKISVSGTTISATEINFTGKFSVAGFMDFSTDTGKISRAKMTLKVPAELDRALQMVQAGGLLPLSQTGPGEWKVER